MVTTEIKKAIERVIIFGRSQFLGKSSKLYRRRAWIPTEISLPNNDPFSKVIWMTEYYQIDIFSSGKWITYIRFPVKDLTHWV